MTYYLKIKIENQVIFIEFVKNKNTTKESLKENKKHTSFNLSIYKAFTTLSPMSVQPTKVMPSS